MGLQRNVYPSYEGGKESIETRNTMIKIILKRGRDESLRRFHPWVFSGAIAQVQGNPAEGDVVAVHDADGSFLAYGHYQVGSIAVRVLSFDADVLAPDFWEVMLDRALQVRVACGLDDSENTNCYRLVHGEGDNLPGLIIDIYGNTAVMQAHSVGMHVNRLQIANAMKEVLGDKLKNIYYKSDTTLPYKADINKDNGYILGGNAANISTEYGLKFHIDWLRGQKTGFFVDQRENRSLLEKYAKGRKLLNMFCYTGGFSIYALRGGAELVHSVDSSSKAIDLTNANVAIDTVVIIARLDTLLPILAPTKRPISIINQYTATIIPTVPAGIE